MTLPALLKKYFAKEMDAIQIIRILSGSFNPEHAITILSLICTITRHEQGDIDTETFKAVWKIDQEGVFNDGDYPIEYDDMTLKDLEEALEKLQKKAEGLEDLKDDSDLSQDIALMVSYLAHRAREEDKAEEEQKNAN
jgi:hypothetical protein